MARAPLAQPPLPLAESRTYVALDLETTGTRPDSDQIIEVGAVRFRGPEVLETFSSLIRPGRPIPYHIQQLTGITEHDVRAAPTMEEVIDHLTAFVGQDPIVGHNIGFDLGFLRRWGVGLGNPAIDTWPLSRVLLPTAASHSLAGLAEELGLLGDGKGLPGEGGGLPGDGKGLAGDGLGQLAQEAHRAQADADLSRLLYLRLLEEGARLHHTILEALVDMAQRSSWGLEPVFRQLLARSAREAFQKGERPLRLETLEEDLAGDLRLHKVEEHPRDELVPLDPEALQARLEPGGALAAALEGFERRPEQEAMLLEVARAFNEGRHLLVEAGTGTGKSLAYLVPAILFATANGRRVVVASHTINLQEQLWKKDIPALTAALGARLRAGLLKGRGNYVCLRRLRGLRLHPSLDPEAAALVGRTLVWLWKDWSQGRPGTGDRSEMGSLSYRELGWWRHISSESEECRQSTCGNEAPCFFFRARQRAAQAHLVVVNHALLLTDAFVSQAVLPDYEHLVIDEAHRLEDVATDALSFRGSDRDARQAVLGLGESLRLLAAHARRLQLEGVARPLEEAQERLSRLGRAGERLFGALREFWQEQRHDGDNRLRLTAASRASGGWTGVELALGDVGAAYGAARGPLDRILEMVLDSDDPVVHQLRQARADHDLLWEGLIRALEGDQANLVTWLERRTPQGGEDEEEGREDRLSVHLAPIHVGELLRSGLFQHLETAVLTSATLRTAAAEPGSGEVHQSFDYLSDRLGLEAFEEVALGSPFDYQRSVLVYVPRDMPEPNQPGYQAAVEETLARLLRATEGRALVLFTSWSQLRQTYKAVGPVLNEAGIRLLAQGLGGSRHRLLEQLKRQERAALLGTASFWEGVDVPGPALSCLVIARLPFDVPSDPVFAARAEQFDRPFEEYGLPRAILRFRQGFGRLIRRKTDRGILVVLDSRLAGRAYGAAFRAALPACRWQVGPRATLPQAARGWLEG